jgi:tetratricopeptide (TPR) repeat protein
MLPRAAAMRRPRHHLIQRLGGLALVLGLLLLGCEGPSSRVRDSLRAGDQAARQRALREALNYYRTAAVAEPGSIEAQTRRGAMAEVLGEFGEALEAYGRATRIESSSLAYYRAGAMAERMGNGAVAIEYLGASLGAPPTRSERAARTGRRFIEGVSAALDGSRLSRMLPAWFFQSLDVGRVVLANAALDREVVAGALYVTLVEEGQPERALELARARRWVREGADYCAGAPEQAASETRALVGMLAAPERTDCLLMVGRSLTDGGLVRLARLVLLDRTRRSADPRVRERAAAFLRRRLPGHDVAKVAESLNVAGYNLQHRFRDAAGAATAYQRAIAADPGFSWPYANLGLLYLDMDQPDVALDWLRTAIRINPDHFRAHVNLGVALASMRRYDEAVTAYRAALGLDPDDAFVHASLGRALLSLGRDGEGLRELQTAVRLDPSLTEARDLLNRRVAADPHAFQPD